MSHDESPPDIFCQVHGEQPLRWLMCAECERLFDLEGEACDICPCGAYFTPESDPKDDANFSARVICTGCAKASPWHPDNAGIGLRQAIDEAKP